MAAPRSTRLRSTLQAAAKSVQWTYSIFWQICPQQGYYYSTTDHISRVIILPLYMYTIYLSSVFRILTWGDGYYNGPIKTRKTVQPMEVSEEEASLERSQQLRELYGTLSAGETDQPPARASLSPEDLNETEWFFLMCISFSFPPGDG